MRHELKVLPAFFDAVADGTKPFEVRKDNRGFEVGHTLQLKEFVPCIARCMEGILGQDNSHFTGRVTEKRITYVLRHEDFPDGVPEGYAVLGLAPIGGA